MINFESFDSLVIFFFLFSFFKIEFLAKTALKDTEKGRLNMDHVDRFLNHR